ncbi:hypothetical protein EVAR_55044_1 [Eumeta japonica]|uniref:Uncharacterized protein n=1 Tax=Eumeta variegata TaxID=151549 RepID=A0A4C1ZQY9_EUMVA|nr:hypothetical protein EVAR_55044_1 [Eumeta japonica]
MAVYIRMMLSLTYPEGLKDLRARSGVCLCARRACRVALPRRQRQVQSSNCERRLQDDRYAEAFIWKCDPHFALFLFSYPAYVCTAAIKDGASRWARPQCGDGSASVAGLAPAGVRAGSRRLWNAISAIRGGNASGAPPAVPRRPELGRHHRYSLDARSSATSLRHGTMYIIPIRVIGISAEEENGLPETRNSFLRGPQRTSDSSMLRVSMGSGENLLLAAQMFIRSLKYCKTTSI